MILKNNSKGLLVLSDSLAGVHLTLIPGNNEVADADYEKVVAGAKFEIEHGVLEEVNGEVELIKTGTGKNLTVTGKVGDDIIPFEKLSAQKAKALIKDTASIETLEKWLEVEERPEIRVVIQNKIDAVKNYEGPGSEKKEK